MFCSCESLLLCKLCFCYRYQPQINVEEPGLPPYVYFPSFLFFSSLWEWFFSHLLSVLGLRSLSLLGGGCLFVGSLDYTSFVKTLLSPGPFLAF